MSRKNKKDKVQFRNKKPLLIQIIVMTYKFTKFVGNSILIAIEHIIEAILNKLRFSIAFKITVTFIIIFLLFFSILSASISSSYDAFYSNGSHGDYSAILGTILGLFNFLGLVLIAIVGSRIIKKLLSPIDTMTKLVKQISIDDLSQRLDVSGSKDELKDLAQTFNDMQDRLQSAVELQNQFVSDASHELRTPISVIQGYANLIDRWGKDDPKILEESILSIKSESEWMKNLVEKLLFLARSDKNTQRLEKNNFMLNEIIDEVFKETTMIDDNHKILNNMNDNIEISADRNLLKEAIRIFVDNSIKYTPAGGAITLNSVKDKNSAIITIKDTGIGISKDDLPHIFNRFYCVDKSRTKSSGGTGLGLGIAKWIIEHHNGSIKVSSQLNAGTEVIIKIPTH
jgi:two-component system, OmpR family, sensor histidine kinase ArlS